MSVLEIDNVDRQIISILTADAKMPYSRVAEKVFVSDGTVHVRMKKMEQMGIIKGATLIIDHRKLGYDLTAFVGIYLEKASVYKDVISRLEDIPEVVEASYTTGNYSIFAKIICQNTDHLLNVLNHKVQMIEGIRRTETFISLETAIRRQVAL